MTLRAGARRVATLVGLTLALVWAAQSSLAHEDEEHAAGPTPSVAQESPLPSAAESVSATSSPMTDPVAETSNAPLASLPPGTLEATGIVLSVDSPALGRVDSFVLLSQDGEQLTFDTSELPFDPSFPVSHVAEHQMTSEPVRVYYAIEGERLVVIALVDAE